MSMRWYVVRRLAWTLLATYFALSITFGLLALSPNTGEMQASFAAASSGGDPEAAREAYRERRGLDEPLHERYVGYMTNMVTFNWGWSTMRNQPVMAAIGDAWPYSAQIMIPSIIAAAVVGFGVGLYSALHRHTPTDYGATFFAFFGISIPNFWFAIMMILVFSVWMQGQTWFTLAGLELPSALAPPTYYHTGIGFFTLQNLHQIIMPIIVVATAAIAGQMRYSRAAALEYVQAEFVKTARAKGASEWRVLTRHILRVALIPLSTILIAEALALLWAGALLAEVVFQIPGIGLLAYKAIIDQDTSLVLATTLIPVFLALFSNLLQDLAYVWLDPRIDYGDRT